MKFGDSIKVWSYRYEFRQNSFKAQSSLIQIGNILLKRIHKSSITSPNQKNLLNSVILKINFCLLYIPDLSLE
ncbi:hypothetical protein J43TS3_14640 [Ornithinibacillus bavariensis]|uniref:Uncharacterized protein n=1 Tax=Ornithinibacillus bavariensis TaxID=545502 RepID=A0A919XA60_9BACI|nr:hypothetical protein J43TS3_14640 [Ornithinibacillus bavariensis]